MARRSRFLEDLIGGVGLGAGLADMYMEREAGEAYTGGLKNAVGGVVPYVDATGDGTGAGSTIQTPASAAQQRTAGLQAMGDYWSGRGNIKRASDLYDQVDQMGLRSIQKEAAELEVGAKKRSAEDDKKFRAIATDVESWRSRLQDTDPEKRMAAWQELTSKHNGSDWGGRTFSKVEGIGQDGKLYAYVADPDSGRVMPVNLDDPAMTEKILGSYAQHQMKSVNPQAMKEWMAYEQKSQHEAGLQRRHEQTLGRYDADREQREKADARRHSEAMKRLDALMARNTGKDKLDPAVQDRMDFLQSNYGRLQQAYNKAATAENANPVELRRLEDQMQDLQSEMYDLPGVSKRIGAKSKEEFLGLASPAAGLRAFGEALIRGTVTEQSPNGDQRTRRIGEEDYAAAVAGVRRMYRHSPKLRDETLKKMETAWTTFKSDPTKGLSYSSTPPAEPYVGDQYSVRQILSEGGSPYNYDPRSLRP